MLTFSLDAKTGILEVTETLMSFTATRTSYWYYDIVNWLVSNMGKKDEAPTRVMVPDAIEWVRKYYLPHVLALPARPQADLSTTF